MSERRASGATWLVGGGEMGDLVRAFDWSKTSLGPIDTWPQSLRTAVSLCLSSTFPMNIIWGPESLQIYNDGYRVVCGDVHPRSLGEDYRVTWASAWPAIGDSFERAWSGERMFLENQRMFLKRLNGSDLEETFFTFSHSPIHDESGRVGGLFHPVTETTANMLAERRTRALRDLAASLATPTDETELAHRTVEALSQFEFDLPFVLYYSLDPESGRYDLVAHHGVEAARGVMPASVAADDSAPWPFAAALAQSAIVEVDDLRTILHGARCGPYDEPPNVGFVIPIVVPAADRPPAVIVTAASPRLPLSADYRSLYDLLGVTIAGALAAVRAREDERRRAEALAEIDRAKTVFFSNVSHEFRTPLTLMLGPLQDALASGRLPEEERDRLDVAHRNSLRLLKLVNSLLDFARIEAGRTRASYEPVDLAELTVDLASNFRSACERAGIELRVDCPPLPDVVHVDRDMWEKIVLNLLSNAFKFTFEGGIAVRLRAVDERVELSVSDTGVGIPEHELPRVFERFHRLEEQRSRTHEGSGIGLALVQELVRLNGGKIGVASRVDEGTTFTIEIPFGTAHLPRDRIGAAPELAPTSVHAKAYVEEALRWLPDGADVVEQVFGDDVGPPREPGERARVLVADDNSDMRSYVRRVLARRYDVETVPDGQAALAALRARRPNIVITDVMMPRLDGFGLLRAIRAESETQDIHVIMLSARAGEESRLESLSAGADDYLVKPFSTQELVTRIESCLNLARVRADASRELRDREVRFRELVEQTPDGIFVASPDGRYIDVNPAGCEMLGMTRDEVLGSTLTDVVVPEQHHRLPGEIARFDDGSVVRSEWRLRRADGTVFDAEILGRRLANGNLQGLVRDVTEDRRREEALRESEERLRMLADNMNQLAWTCDHLGVATWYNQRWYDYTGFDFEEMKDRGWERVQHPDHIDRVIAGVTAAQERGEAWEDTFPLRGRDGTYRWFLTRAVPIHDESGRIVRWFGTNTDVTEQRRAEETLRMLTGELSHRVKNMLATIQAIATQTLRHNPDPERFVSSFGGRLQSMARVHSMLSHTDWQGADLRDVIDDQLFSAAVDRGSVQVAGPALRLAAQMVPQTAMILHELGTNSIKYGALSRPGGTISLNWAVHDDTLNLSWSETGGPRIDGPVRRGFGTSLIERSATTAGGAARMLIEARGIRWDILLPLPDPGAAAPHVAPLPKSSAAGYAVPHAGERHAASASVIGKRIMIVEDEPLVALDIVATLEGAGVEVVGPVGGIREALALIEREDLDAALLDANLRGLPVTDIAAALARRNVPFAFVSGYGRDGLPDPFAEAPLLAKPFSPQQLHDVTSNLVRKADAGDNVGSDRLGA